MTEDATLKLPLGIDIRYRADVGRALFAAQSYQAGNLIFSESPLVGWRFGGENVLRHHPAYQLVSDAAGGDELLACTVIRFLTIPRNVYDRLKDFARPPPGTRHPLLEKYKKLVQYCYSSIDDFKRMKDSEIHCEWFLQSAYTNAHHCPQLATCGMFEVASKMAHSCDPNCIFYISVDEDGSITLSMVAMKDIGPEEILCCSYLNELDLLGSQSYRQQCLWRQKFFTCACRRCSLSPSISELGAEERACIARLHQSIAGDKEDHLLFESERELAEFISTTLMVSKSPAAPIQLLSVALSYSQMVRTGGPCVPIGRFNQKLIIASFLFYRSLLESTDASRIMVAGWICWGIGWIRLPAITEWLPIVQMFPAGAGEGAEFDLSTSALVLLLHRGSTSDPQALDGVMNRLTVERMMGELCRGMWADLKRYCKLEQLLPDRWQDDIFYLNSLRRRYPGREINSR